MSKPMGQSVRLLLLAALLGGTVLALGRAIVAPKAVSAIDATHSLPASIPLEGWQPVSASVIPSDKEMVAAQRYQYRQNNTVLDIEMGYGGSADGNVNRFLLAHTPIKSANSGLQQRQHPELGTYGVLTFQNRAYLSACINSRGGSTVTEQQFTQNRYHHDLQISRVVPWVLGQEPFLDRRCLWALMSVPLEAGTQPDPARTEAAYKSLESAWLPWVRWWQANYPPA